MHLYIYAYIHKSVNLIRDLRRRIYIVISCSEVRELGGYRSYMIYMHTNIFQLKKIKHYQTRIKYFMISDKICRKY